MKKQLIKKLEERFLRENRRAFYKFFIERLPGKLTFSNLEQIVAELSPEKFESTVPWCYKDGQWMYKIETNDKEKEEVILFSPLSDDNEEAIGVVIEMSTPVKRWDGARKSFLVIVGAEEVEDLLLRIIRLHDPHAKIVGNFEVREVKRREGEIVKIKIRWDYCPPKDIQVLVEELLSNK